MDLDVHLPSICAADADAFGRWVAGSELRIRLSLNRFATQVDVEAVLQETLLRVWQVAPQLSPDGRPNMLLRFAIRVARNTAISAVRRERKEVPLQTEEEVVDPTEPDPMLREVIAFCRDKLPAKPALALTQRLTSPAVADHLLAAQVSMQRNTFLQNITRARKLLVECLRRSGVELVEVMR